MPVKPINSKKEFYDILANGKVIFIDFWATWCGPCRMISPIFEKLAEELTANDGVEFYKVDVDEVPDVAQEVGIKAMPTFQVYKNSERIGDLVGANPAALTSLIQTNV